MSANVEFQEETQAAIPVASSVIRKRLFLDTSDGFFKTKDSAGIVAPISALAVPWLHVNTGVTVGMSPYAAVVQETVKLDVNTGAITVNLPTAVGIAGRQIKVVSLSDVIGPNVGTVVPFGGQTINGQANYTLTTPRERVIIESDGFNWLVVD